MSMQVQTSSQIAQALTRGGKSGTSTKAETDTAPKTQAEEALDRLQNASQDEVEGLAKAMDEGRKEWARQELEDIKTTMDKMAMIRLLDPEQYARTMERLADRLDHAVGAYEGAGGHFESASGPADATAAQGPDAPASVKAAWTAQVALYAKAEAEVPGSSNPDQSFAGDAKSLANRIETAFRVAKKEAEKDEATEARMEALEADVKAHLDKVKEAANAIQDHGDEAARATVIQVASSKASGGETGQSVTLTV